MATSTEPFMLRLPPRVRRELTEAAEGHGTTANKYAVTLILHGLQRGQYAHLHREVVFQGRSADAPIDAMLEWLASRRPALGELVNNADHAQLSGRVRRVVVTVCGEKVADRIDQVVVQGRTLDEVGKREGVSRQAVHQSLRAAFHKLAANPEFVGALCLLFPESGLTPEMLRAARAGRIRG